MLKSVGFTGRSDNKVDSKGRLSIPVSMRKDLAPGEHDEVVVLCVPPGHLALFNREYWNTGIQQLVIDSRVTIGAENVKRAIHRLSETSHASTIDAQGRITIPQRLLKDAGIDGDALVIGAGDRISVWAPDRYRTWIGETDIDRTIADLGLF